MTWPAAGSQGRGRGTLMIDPIAVLTMEGVTVPDLALTTTAELR